MWPEACAAVHCSCTVPAFFQWYFPSWCQITFSYLPKAVFSLPLPIPTAWCQTVLLSTGSGSVASSHPRGEGEVTARISPCWVTSLLLSACQVCSGMFCVIGSETFCVTSGMFCVRWFFYSYDSKAEMGLFFGQMVTRPLKPTQSALRCDFPVPRMIIGWTECNPQFSGRTEKEARINHLKREEKQGWPALLAKWSIS